MRPRLASRVVDSFTYPLKGCEMVDGQLEQLPGSVQNDVNLVVQGLASTVRRRASATRRWYRWLTIAFTAVAALIASSYGYTRYMYPYGWTHCCDKQLYSALRNYADLHHGKFPSGQATPEACLSLLHAKPIEASANLLGGKNVDPEIAEKVFSEGQLLSPQSCGWNYVPGLSLTDDPRLALFWDKPGLGHNGQRLDGGGHIVWFVGGEYRQILASEWESFLAEQRSLRQNAGQSK